MKRIYFARHAEGENNIGALRGDSSSPLTEKGREQATYLSERATKLPIDLVITSTMQRAIETGEIIANKINKQLESVDLFNERRRPSIVYNKPKDDPEMLKIVANVNSNFHDENFRHSDEENFPDLKARVEKALDFLENKKENNIFVISHAYFIKILIGYVIMGKDLTGKECREFVNKFDIVNTGLTVLLFDKNWWILTVNDHAHLG